MLAFLGGATIVVVSRLRVKWEYNMHAPDWLSTALSDHLCSAEKSVVEVFPASTMEPRHFVKLRMDEMATKITRELQIFKKKKSSGKQTRGGHQAC